MRPDLIDISCEVLMWLAEALLARPLRMRACSPRPSAKPIIIELTACSEATHYTVIIW